MGTCGRIGLFVTVVLFAFLFQKYRSISKPLPLPEFDLERYWGRGEPVKDDVSIVPFKIDFNEKDLDRLKEKLSDLSGLVPPLEDAKFHYGFNSEKLAEVIKYWRGTYLDKWYTERQVYLNQHPQFMTQIQG